MKRIALIVAFFLVLTPHALACRGWQWETVTFHARLPKLAEREPVAAEVEVVKMISAQANAEWVFSHLVLVRVVKPLQGVRAGQEFVVNARNTTCDQYMSMGAIGRRYFVAGRFVKTESGETEFTGRWKRDMASGGMVKDAD